MELYYFSFVRHLNKRSRTTTDPLAVESIRFHSKRKDENNLDPDDGSSRLCTACNLPIFSTPFKETESRSGYLHDQCSDLPTDLEGNDLHPSLEPLEKRPNNLPESNCSNCEAVCGDVVYRCRGAECNFQLDVTCAWTVKIMHRSHDHKLTVIRCSAADASFACCVCGTGHRPGLLWARPMPLVYVCSACGFWLHPHCAALPNAIQHKRHHHPLLLNYGPTPSLWRCAICGDFSEKVSSWGVYTCDMCDYAVDIMCAIADSQSFEPVLLREALQEDRVPELVHLPVPDEYTSIVRHIAKSIPTTSDDEMEHEHPLTLHYDYPDYDDGDDKDDDVHQFPTCDACVQFISPPFYTCSRCPKLFLHDSCARLPSALSRNSTGEPRLLNEPNQLNFVMETTCCNRLTNGFHVTYFAYPALHIVDLTCALMPASITHAAHAKTHVLRLSYLPVASEKDVCGCCDRFLSGVSYKCATCRSFSIHATCARLPATVRHGYDPHPLKLVTVPPTRGRSQMETICDACEQGLDVTQWHYGCAECEQAFHVDCVPCLDELSSIKYETAEVCVSYHKCPLTLVRGHTVRGRRCGFCREGYRVHRDSLAFQCFKCCFSMHTSCVKHLVDMDCM